MKEAILMFIIISIINLIWANKIDIDLQRQIDFKEKYNSGEINEIPACIAKSINSELQKIYLHFKTKPDKKLLQRLSRNNVNIDHKFWIPPLKNHPTGFHLAEIPAKRDVLMNLKSFVEIEHISTAERYFRTKSNLASIETGVAAISENPYNLTGDGVRVAVIDSGFQLDHEDIPEPVAAIDYSEYPDSSYTVSNESTYTGHGTHVAGLIVGQGTLTDGVWKGMAPDADWIAIKVAQDNTGFMSTVSVDYAVWAARFVHDADFINISLGGMDTYLDGSSESDQIVDLVSEDECSVFIANGNEADKDYHYSAFLGAGETTDFITINYSDSTESRDLFYTFNLIWFDGENTSIQDPMILEIFNHNQQHLTLQMIYDMTQSPRGTQSRRASATVFNPNTFYVKVTNESENEQLFHLYVDSFNGTIENADKNYTIMVPATADKAISISSWNTRDEWVNWQALLVSTPSIIMNDISYFSSCGPRVDGTFKPDFAAPGAYIIAARDDDAWSGPPFGLMTPGVISNIWATGDTSGGLPADYIALQGTSMASPVACGAAALIKQYAPEITCDELVELIRQTSRSDGFTGETPNPVWGYGKIDVEAAIEQLNSDINSTNIKKSPICISSFPSPFNPETTIFLSASEEINNPKILIFNAKGQKVKSLVCNETFNIVKDHYNYSVVWNGTDEANKPVSSGVYLYRLENKHNSNCKKMILIK